MQAVPPLPGADGLSAEAAEGGGRLPLKVEADALALGIVLGLYDERDAIRWADEVLAEGGPPSSAIVDISTGAHLDRSAFALLLDAVPGEPDPGRARGVLLHVLRSRLEERRAPVAAVVISLCGLAQWFPDEDVAQIGAFYEMLDPMGSGIDYRGDLAADVLAFLASRAPDLAGRTRLR